MIRYAKFGALLGLLTASLVAQQAATPNRLELGRLDTGAAVVFVRSDSGDWGIEMSVSDRHGEVVGLRTDGLVFKAFHEHLAGALPVAVNGNSPQKPIKGVAGIDTSAQASGSPTYPLDVFAAVSADKKTMTISVINPTETAQECNLTFSGMQVAGSGKVWRITAPAGAAPVASGGRGAGGAPATMEEKAGQDASAKISVPAASISLYEFPVK